MGLFDRWQKKQSKIGKKSGVKVPPVAKVAAEEKKEQAVVQVDRPAINRKVSLPASRVVIKPAVTEKAAIAESINKYTFIVTHEATKKQVKSAINEIYGVKPLSVNLINVEGKNVRFGRHSGRRSDYKKAVVTLPQGKTISVHEGV